MTEPRSEFLRTVISRGFLHQCTDLDALDALASKGKPITAYIGFDCTADSLHVGSLVQIMLLRHLQRSGHKPVVLLGGGTTKVGDPSGKDESRKLLTEDEIARNLAGIKEIFERFLTFGTGRSDAVFVNNAEWLDGLEYIPFLRDIGRHFSVNRMLGFDSVKLRLDREQPLSFLEFNYMVLQAYDFLELAKRQDCVLQMGGSDQWGNIVSGVDLVRRMTERTVYGLTAPLITTANGEKMGKTAKGAIWLDADKFSPNSYWQFWRNTTDTDVSRFLRLFTDLPMAEIARLEKLQGAELNDAKKILANEATTLAYDKQAAELATNIAIQTFGPAAGTAPTLSETQTQQGRATLEGTGALHVEAEVISRTELEKQISVVELLRRFGLASSNSESRRLIRGGGARINDMPVSDEAAMVGVADVKDGIIKLSAGKKRHALIRVG